MELGLRVGARDRVEELRFFKVLGLGLGLGV